MGLNFFCFLPPPRSHCCLIVAHEEKKIVNNQFCIIFSLSKCLHDKVLECFLGRFFFNYYYSFLIWKMCLSGNVFIVGGWGEGT